MKISIRYTTLYLIFKYIAMIIIVNGKQQDIENNISVLDFINLKKLNPSKIIIELNRQIITKAVYESVILKENDNLEILSLVTGG